MIDGRRAAEECGVVAAAAAEDEGFEVEFEGECGLVGLIDFPGVVGAGVCLGVGVEPVDDGSASAGVAADFELADEVIIEADEASAFGVERGDAFGAGGGEGEGEAVFEGVPIGFFGVFPAAEPFESVADVADFIEVDFFEDGCGGGVADLAEEGGVVFGEIEVGLFEGEVEAGDEIEGSFHGGDDAPEVVVYREIAEVDAAFAHAADVHECVGLFFAHGFVDAGAVFGWGVREAEEDEGHEFGGEEFMVGEEVEHDAAFAIVIEVVDSGEVGADAVGSDAEFLGAAGGVWEGDGGAGCFV